MMIKCSHLDKRPLRKSVGLFSVKGSVTGPSGHHPENSDIGVPCGEDAQAGLPMSYCGELTLVLGVRRFCKACPVPDPDLRLGVPDTDSAIGDSAAHSVALTRARRR